MVSRYPYQLWAKMPANSVRNEHGDYVPMAADWALVSICRDEANTAGKTVTLDDSTESVYEFLIQLPRSCPALQSGTPIEVRSGTTVRVASSIKRFSADQLHSRAWV